LTQTTVRIREDQQDWLNRHDVLTLSSIVRKQIDELMDADGIVATVDPDEFEFDTESSHTSAEESS
jgi:nucleoside 2-deoxyribosyltransferase